ncbi:MAG TPA: GAF domain-containing protein [Verrucomicrobiae bacterium]|nr:GAF domain-containing protein [Verrucomicrobiae bacterium]
MKPELDQIASLLAKDGDRQAVLEETLRRVLALLNSETGTIHRLDGEKQLLHLTAHVGLPAFMLDIVRTIPVGKGIAGETVVRGGPVTMCNLQTDTSGVAKPGAKQTGVGGALCVPIRQGDAIVGTIGVGTKREYEYAPEETKLLEEIGRLLGNVVKQVSSEAR